MCNFETKLSDDDKLFDKLTTNFAKCYNILGNDGAKTDFHQIVSDTIMPPLSLSSIRVYCSDLTRVPLKNRIPVIKHITKMLILQATNKKDQLINIYQAPLDDLQTIFELFLSNNTKS